MFRSALLSLALAAFPLAGPATAQSTDDMVSVSILPGWRDADGTHVAALRFEMAEGWKTYWRAPGEAGIPPRFDWRNSDNLRAVDILWPTPQQTTTNGMRTIGYERDLILPVRLTPTQAGQPITLAADLEIGICNDICVPVDTKVRLELPLDPGHRDPRIAAALAARPYTAAEAGVGRVTCAVSPIEGGLRLSTEIEMKQMGQSEMVAIETDNPELWVAQSDTSRNGNRLNAETEIYHVDGRGVMLNRGALRFTVLSTGDAVDIQGCTGR
ncbi:protein-disulfide reductase DsbD domain-containing protein [Roseovarius autotrophicus]|uniref:protein-disulfide reductase DsbD domain-containing protein n=1 Tax=Roseovarius autotrophicus TaxID=2824121 RepID=UPI001B398284|nr:protein-disulfide reductase DsbD domain-containing protein [Roseovarius autotrophicus]